VRSTDSDPTPSFAAVRTLRCNETKLKYLRNVFVREDFLDWIFRHFEASEISSEAE